MESRGREVNEIGVIWARVRTGGNGKPGVLSAIIKSRGCYLAREWGSKDGIIVVWVRVEAGGISVVIGAGGEE